MSKPPTLKELQDMKQESRRETIKFLTGKDIELILFRKFVSKEELKLKYPAKDSCPFCPTEDPCQRPWCPYTEEE